MPVKCSQAYALTQWLITPHFNSFNISNIPVSIDMGATITTESIE